MSKKEKFLSEIKDEESDIFVASLGMGLLALTVFSITLALLAFT